MIPVRPQRHFVWASAALSLAIALLAPTQTALALDAARDAQGEAPQAGRSPARHAAEWARDPKTPAPVLEPSPQSRTPGDDNPLSPNWIVTVQLGPGILPIYPGAGRVRFVPIPNIDVRPPGEKDRFSAPDDGISAGILDVGAFRAGPVANFVPPRDPKFPETYGLRKVSIAAEVGGFAEYYWNDIFRLRGELRQGVHGHSGLTGSLSADLINRTGAVQVTVGPRLRFGSGRFAQAYFGVSPWEASANHHLPVYRPEGGLVSAGLMTTVRYDFSKQWNAMAYGGLNRLAGSAAASPIPTMVGSRNQFSAGLLFARSFEISGL